MASYCSKECSLHCCLMEYINMNEYFESMYITLNFSLAYIHGYMFIR